MVSKILKEESPGIYLGCLVNQADIGKLKKAGVAYTGKESLSDCIGVVYKWQVIKKVR